MDVGPSCALLSTCAGRRLFPRPSFVIAKRFYRSAQALTYPRTFFQRRPGIPKRIAAAIHRNLPFAKLHRGYLDNAVSVDNSEALDTQDLRKFLTQVGTEGREARYWLRHFQESTAVDSYERPFAVVYAPSVIMSSDEMVKSLASHLAFLQRNNMAPVLVHGIRGSKLQRELQSNRLLPEDYTETDGNGAALLQATQQLLSKHTMKLMDALQAALASAQLLPSAGLLYVKDTPVDTNDPTITSINRVNEELLTWSLQNGSIPVVSSLGQTSSGQLKQVEPFHALAAIVRCLRPRKVLLLNTTGGLRDENGQTISEVNCPTDYEKLLRQPWCKDRFRFKVKRLFHVLGDLPDDSSIVVTSPSAILQELFTFHGSGTIFQKRDGILSFDSLADVDCDRLQQLICRSFNRQLDKTYFSYIAPKLLKIYVSERYTFAAIITREEGAENVPYLNKFAVVSQSQGTGTSQALWDCLRRDFPRLFWRSYHSNHINSWYFRRCRGSHSAAKWKIFWYGLDDQLLSQKLIEVAKNLPESFVEGRPDVEAERQQLDDECMQDRTNQTYLALEAI